MFLRTMLIDCHMHTPLCRHATGTPREVVAAAVAQGLQTITITCHIPMERQDLFRHDHIRMRQHELPEYRAWVEEVRAEAASHELEVLYGIEAEVYPEEEALRGMDEIIAAEKFDFVLGSLHQQLPGYRQRWAQLGATADRDRIEVYFRDLAAGVRTGRYHSLAHPDIVRSYGGIAGEFVPSEHETVIRDFLAAVKESETCLEINTSGLHKEQFLVHPHPDMLRWVAQMDIPITMGSDAHNPGQIGYGFRETRELLKEMGFASVSYFRKSRREQLPLA